jgi:two-component system, OmpR family, phosphate regulon response regulator PhoB
VVLLSARGRSEDLEAGMQAGADAYLVKPFSPLALIETINAQWEAA